MKAITKETVQDRKNRLIAYIDMLNDKQIKSMEILIDIANKPFNKHTMIEFIKDSLGHEYTDLRNYDTAFPVNYYNEIYNIYPGISKGNFVYDYSNLSYGKLTNLNDLFIESLYKNMTT